MNAGQAFALVADFIEGDENSKDRVWRTMKLACNHAWGKGKWWGMTADFWCKVFTDPCGSPYIFAPPGYDTLLGVNYDGKSRIMRDVYFMFHKNGPGDIKDHNYCQWNRDVYDAGEVPTLHDINIYSKCGGVMIGIRSIGTPGEDEYVSIIGKTDNQNEVYTYEFKEKNKCNCVQAVEDENSPVVRTVQGLRIKVSDKFEYVDNVFFKDITHIYKTITKCPIEVIFINSQGEAFVTARISPYDTKSSYRKYTVPNGCCGSIHGVFKIAKQRNILDDSQPIIIDNEEALVALCKGINLKYNKEQAAAGEAYLASGVIALEEELREKQSPIQTPIQVVGVNNEDVPDILKYY